MFSRPSKTERLDALQVIYVQQAPKRTSCLTWLAAIVLIPAVLVTMCAELGRTSNRGTPADAPSAAGQGKPSDDLDGLMMGLDTKDEIDLKASWSKGGFGSVMIADLTLTNNSKRTVKDIGIRSSVRGESGTRVGYLNYTATIILKPGEKRTIKGANFGRIAQQAAKAEFKVLSCVVVE